MRLRSFTWFLIAMSWCSVAGAAGIVPATCSEGEKLEIDALVLRGLATPDELIVRVPAFLAPLGAEFLAFFKTKKPVLFAGDPPERIGNGLYVILLSSNRSQTLEEKAARLTQVDFLLNQISLIRTPSPAQIYIPPSLGEIFEQKDILDFLLQTSVIPAVAPAISTAAFSGPDWTTRTEPSTYVHASAYATPTDEHFTKQCGLRAVNADDAWRGLYPVVPIAPDVRVAIVDSGLAFEHDDLHPYAAPNTAADRDSNGHGTHIAGIIGAVKDDARGVVGVTWRTNITAYRFLDSAGRGTLADALKQIDLALTEAQKPHIVVLAWGVAIHSPELFAALKAANKVLFVAPAGNLAQDICDYPLFPAAYDLPNLLSVMATTCDDLRAPFSSFGETSVDLAAPGEGRAKSMRIFSTVLNDRYGNLAGTSMSTAFVAGAAALVLQASFAIAPDLTPGQIKCWLNHTATDLAALQGRSRSQGRLNLAEVVKPLNRTTCAP